MRRFVPLLSVLIILVAAGVLFKDFLNKQKPTGNVGNRPCTLDAKACPDGTKVGRVPPSCQFDECPTNLNGITVYSPYTNETISSPLNISGTAIGPWYFEAIFNAELYDSEGNKLATAILTAQEEWMTTDYVHFRGTLEFETPGTESGVLKFLSANPSGLPEHQKQFEVAVKFD